MIAGWPFGVVENVPYLALREVLVSWENHVVVHEEYAREMGARTRALIAAYYAADVEPVRRLKDDYGVTHLLVDRRHYEGEVQWYFEPFASELVEARAALTGEPEVLRQAGHAAVMSSGPWLLLDLHRLEGGSAPRGGRTPEGS